MRTGLKLLYRKTRDKLKEDFTSWLGGAGGFPERSEGQLRFWLRLRLLVRELKDIGVENHLGSLHSKPHQVALKTWIKLLPFNPNHLGNWSVDGQELFDDGKRIESRVVEMMIDLYGGNKNEWEGYITSGATESAIFSSWLGRVFLKNDSKKSEILMMLNNLSHYSLKKTASVMGIKTVNLALKRESWNISTKNLEDKINKFNKKGVSSFILPLTLGYTQTGTNDDYERILKITRRLEEKLRINVYVYVDAALNGLVLPFTKKNFKPLKQKNLQTIYVDFHKAGMSLIPSGVVLYRKNLRKLVEQDPGYILQNTTTLLGSRSGIPAVAIYGVIKSLGREGFRELVIDGQERKIKFKDVVRRKFPDVEVVDDVDGIVFGIISKRKLPNDFIWKYGIFAYKKAYQFEKNRESYYIYKVGFLPRL